MIRYHTSYYENTTSSALHFFPSLTNHQLMTWLKAGSQNKRHWAYSVWCLLQGPLAFYKGFLPNFGRLGSWNVIMFLTLEQVQATYNTCFSIFFIFLHFTLCHLCHFYVLNLSPMVEKDLRVSSLVLKFPFNSCGKCMISNKTLTTLWTWEFVVLA